MYRTLIPLFFASFAIMICSSAFGQGGFGEADANDDKKVDAKELKEYVSGKLEGFDQFDALFKEIDTDNDDAISAEEFENRMAAVQKVMSGETAAKKVPEPPAEQRTARRRPPSLKVGDVAPTFKLKSLDGESETDMASFNGKKPVVLIFGSYT
jgi:hypothetical protein